MTAKILIQISAITLAMSGVAASATVDVWSRYNAMTHARCPSRHLEEFPDVYEDLLTGFVGTLPLQTQNRVAANFKYTGACLGETFGESCEMYTYMVAFDRLGLLSRFADYSCRHWTCDYAAYCHPRAR